MLRQEYINHLASVEALTVSPSSTMTLAAVKTAVRANGIPTRAQIVLESSLGVGDWGSSGWNAPYPYQYVVDDGMQIMFLFYDIYFGLVSKVVPLTDPYAAVRNAPNSTVTYPPYVPTATLAANQTVKVTSAYRNPERNEVFHSTPTSNHMLGRALDLGVNNIGSAVSLKRGVAFYKLWQVMHGANPGDTGYTNAKYPDGTSPSVPWADFWQLEGEGGATDVVLKSQANWVTKKNGILTENDIDKNQNGIVDGYEKTYHLHIEDKPNVGAHQ